MLRGTGEVLNGARPKSPFVPTGANQSCFWLHLPRTKVPTFELQRVAALAALTADTATGELLWTNLKLQQERLTLADLGRLRAGGSRSRLFW